MHTYIHTHKPTFNLTALFFIFYERTWFEFDIKQTQFVAGFGFALEELLTLTATQIAAKSLPS